MSSWFKNIANKISSNQHSKDKLENLIGNGQSKSQNKSEKKPKTEGIEQNFSKKRPSSTYEKKFNFTKENGTKIRVTEYYSDKKSHKNIELDDYIDLIEDFSEIKPGKKNGIATAILSQRCQELLKLFGYNFEFQKVNGIDYEGRTLVSDAGEQDIFKEFVSLTEYQSYINNCVMYRLPKFYDENGNPFDLDENSLLKNQESRKLVKDRNKNISLLNMKKLKLAGLAALLNYIRVANQHGKKEVEIRKYFFKILTDAGVKFESDEVKDKGSLVLVTLTAMRKVSDKLRELLKELKMDNVQTSDDGKIHNNKENLQLN